MALGRRRGVAEAPPLPLAPPALAMAAAGDTVKDRAEDEGLAERSDGGARPTSLVLERLFHPRSPSPIPPPIVEPDRQEVFDPSPYAGEEDASDEPREDVGDDETAELGPPLTPEPPAIELAETLTLRLSVLELVPFNARLREALEARDGLDADNGRVVGRPDALVRAVSVVVARGVGDAVTEDDEEETGLRLESTPGRIVARGVVVELEVGGLLREPMILWIGRGREA